MRSGNEDQVPDADMLPVLEEGGTSLSRRVFIKAGLAGSLLTAVGSKLLLLSKAAAQAPSEFVLIIDLNKCSGCGACEQACNQRNNLPEGKSFIHRHRKADELGCWCLPVQCQHCEDAPCAQVCPANATYRHRSGVVLVNEKVCVGCKYCAVACPYEARVYDENTGVVRKCWLCLDWVLGGGQPACVQACVKGARIFGRRDDPEMEELLVSGRAKSLHTEFGTRPGVVYYIFRDS